MSNSVKQPNCSAFKLKWLKNVVVPLTVAVLGAIVYQQKFAAEVQKTPVISTQDGPLQGLVKSSRDSLKYWAFLGIPYAKQISNKNKFNPPTEPTPWKDVKQATTYSQVCAHFDTLLTAKAMGSLDCLYLNVYVNVESGKDLNKEKKPVLVYIHGGGFVSGSADVFQPDYFMDHDVVLVTMNYRLGPYGFLNLQMGSGAQGNIGLKDQNMALKWVQKHIGAFGGDSNKVMLFGESAGAVATHLHVLSPMSKGLFHRAIVQSGSVLSSWGFTRYPINTAKEYARKMGCSTETNKDLLNCYENKKWEELVSQQFTLMKPLIEIDMFQPSVDGAFLKKGPIEILKAGEFPSIPVMFGVTSGEGGIRSGRLEAMPELIPKLDEDWNTLLKNLMILDAPVSSDVAKKIKEKYFGSMKFADDEASFIKNLTLMLSDSGFFEPVHISAHYHAKNKAPVYLYYYNHTSKVYPGLYSLYSAVSFKEWVPAALKVLTKLVMDWIKEFVLKTESSRRYGISHGEDTFQLWNVHGVSKFISGPDEDFSKAFIKSIVEFAGGSQPLTFRNLKWPPAHGVSSSTVNKAITPYYMLMDNDEDPKMIPEPNENQINFWKKLNEWEIQ